MWRYSPTGQAALLGLSLSLVVGSANADPQAAGAAGGSNGVASAPPVATESPPPASDERAPAALAPAAEPPTSAVPAQQPATVAPAGVEPGSLARVAIRADYAGAKLELRRFGAEDAWRTACAVPCDRRLVVAGMEARVAAQGMTPSKPFRIDPGSGAALLSVNGGSASARFWGRAALFAGIPVSFVGITMLGYGTLDDRSTLAAGGGILLGVGGALVLAALPLLVSGSTEVTNADGDLIGAWRPRSIH
jgi:hypothetical protein